MTGIYSYSVLSWVYEPDFKKVFSTHKMRVDILEEKGARYKIKYKEHHARTQDINTTHWVRKDKVKVDGVAPEQLHFDLRLPYKDE